MLRLERQCQIKHKYVIFTVPTDQSDGAVENVTETRFIIYIYTHEPYVYTCVAMQLMGF